MYSSADLAGDRETSRSTSGVFLFVRAANTFIPSARDLSCVIHSAPKAQIAAADFAIRTEALPALQLWEKLAPRPMLATPMEDKMSVISAITPGKGPTMQHKARTHRIDIALLHEVASRNQVVMRHCRKVDMCADVFTNHFPPSKSWDHVNNSIAHVKPSVMRKRGV